MGILFTRSPRYVGGLWHMMSPSIESFVGTQLGRMSRLAGRNGLVGLCGVLSDQAQFRGSTRIDSSWSLKHVWDCNNCTVWVSGSRSSSRQEKVWEYQKHHSRQVLFILGDDWVSWTGLWNSNCWQKFNRELLESTSSGCGRRDEGFGGKKSQRSGCSDSTI